jgi:HPt (histidine-containing phosphotransfer) domain-containing protein
LRSPAPRAGASSDAPIDRARIEELAGNADGVAYVLGEVEAGARHDILALRAALANGDIAALRLVAHRIKGSALTIGAKRAAEAATSLERAGEASDKAELSRAVQVLTEELNSVLDAAHAVPGAAAA